MPDENRIDKADAALNTDSVVLQSPDSNNAVVDSADDPLPQPKNIRTPKGIYATILPFNGQMEQTIEFRNNNNYRLQETYYPGKKDSIVITTGNWTASDGFIWLYKDQVVRGRYSWNGETLQYYSPVLKKSYDMRQLEDIATNAAWKNRRNQGLLLFGTGTEPFWSISIGRDSLTFNLADWDRPVSLKLASTNRAGDSLIYAGTNDSSELRLVVLPYFCSDGMSDNIYPNRISVTYNQHRYSGCAMVYRQP